MSDVIIKESNIKQFPNEQGVFAGRDFKEGEVVVKYNLKALTKEDFDALSEDEKEFTHSHHGVTYLYSIPERYVNHSPTPNTIQDLELQCDIAKRNIKKGEEITTDASKDDV